MGCNLESSARNLIERRDGSHFQSETEKEQNAIFCKYEMKKTGEARLNENYNTV